MEIVHPSLYKKCNKCSVVARVGNNETKEPTLVDYREQFTSEKIELECDVDLGPETSVFMTAWHEGYFNNEPEENVRREGKLRKVRCPNFEHELVR